MPHDRIALKEIFDDTAQPSPLLACRKFIKEPTKDAYSVQRHLRIGDHYNGQKEDLPFQDDRLITTINRFIKSIPLHPPKAYFYLYIPAYNDPSNRTMIVYGKDEELISKISSSLREIFDAYRNDDLSLLDIKKLAAPYGESEKPAKAKREKSGKVISIDEYLNGAAIDEIEHLPNEEAAVAEETIGRIKFDSSLSVNTFDGERRAGLNKLRQAFAERLHVKIVRTHHDHCLDLTGSKEDVHIAYRAGHKIAPLINDNLPVSAEAINRALREARHEVGMGRVSALLGEAPDRRLKKQAKAERNAASVSDHGFAGVDTEQTDPNQNVKIFTPSAP